jgi:hypothetical protein
VHWFQLLQEPFNFIASARNAINETPQNPFGKMKASSVSIKLLALHRESVSHKRKNLRVC